MYVATERPACVSAVGFYYDLLARRYVADGLIIGDDENDFTLGSEINGAQFTPGNLRRPWSQVID